MSANHYCSKAIATEDIAVTPVRSVGVIFFICDKVPGRREPREFSRVHKFSVARTIAAEHLLEEYPHAPRPSQHCR